MNDGLEKLSQDLLVLQAMAVEMEDYLKSEVLFWPLAEAKLPRLTLGAFLMRKQRLVALAPLLATEEQQALSEALTRYNEALTERIVRFEQRAQQEMEARLRQWAEYLRDLRRGDGAVRQYASAVETRVMMSALVTQLGQYPYRLDPKLPLRLQDSDRGLRGRWHKGSFVWPAAWAPAYPEGEYWYLYGGPTS